MSSRMLCFNAARKRLLILMAVREGGENIRGINLYCR